MDLRIFVPWRSKTQYSKRVGRPLRRVTPEQVNRRQNHAGRADAALRSAAFEKCILESTEFWVRRDAFDRDDARSLRLRYGYEAAIDQRAVHQHRTLCRCTGYAQIVEALAEAARQRAPGNPT